MCILMHSRSKVMVDLPEFVYKYAWGDGGSVHGVCGDIVKERTEGGEEGRR